MTRTNFALRTTEHWRPHAFRPPRTRWDRLLASVRRLLDLQAASIWHDMRGELAHVVGDVLDVGAGAQPYRSLMPADVRYHAIDIAAARKHFDYDMPDTRYYEGSTWPIESQSMDLVLATETLEHVAEPAGFLAEARRVLREDGQLVLTVPFSARWHYVPYDYWRFTPSSLRDLLEAAGFRDVVVHARGDELTTACSKVMALILALVLRPPAQSAVRRAVATPLLPLLLLLALVGRASLGSDGGDDCLGWTVRASAG